MFLIPPAKSLQGHVQLPGPWNPPGSLKPGLSRATDQRWQPQEMPGSEQENYGSREAKIPIGLPAANTEPPNRRFELAPAPSPDLWLISQPVVLLGSYEIRPLAKRLTVPLGGLNSALNPLAHLYRKPHDPPINKLDVPQGASEPR